MTGKAFSSMPLTPKMKIHSQVNPNKQPKNHRFHWEIQIHMENTTLRRKNKLSKIFSNPINKRLRRRTIKVNQTLSLLLIKSQNQNLESLIPHLKSWIRIQNKYLEKKKLKMLMIFKHPKNQLFKNMMYKKNYQSDRYHKSTQQILQLKFKKMKL